MKKYKKNKDLSEETIDQSLFILNHSTGKYLELNPTSKFIWESMSSYEINELIDIYKNKFKISEKDAESDIQNFCELGILFNILDEL